MKKVSKAEQIRLKKAAAKCKPGSAAEQIYKDLSSGRTAKTIDKTMEDRDIFPTYKVSAEEMERRMPDWKSGPPKSPKSPKSKKRI